MNDSPGKVTEHGTELFNAVDRTGSSGLASDQDDGFSACFSATWNEAPAADHDAYDDTRLPPAPVPEADIEQDDNINALEQDGEYDLLAKLQHKVLVVALPSSVKQEGGKGKGKP